MAVVLCIGLVGGAFAYFTDTETSSTNSFTAGTLTISDTGITSAGPIVITCMAPGDVTDKLVYTIENDGCLDLIWFADWQFTSTVDTHDLMDALYIDYAKMEFLNPAETAVWLDEAIPANGYETDGSDLFILDGVGHGPYPTWYNTLAALSGFGVVTLTNWDDNNGMGTTPYEHVGALKAGYKYRLTVKFGFAPGASNDYQGEGPVTVKLVVDAIQLNLDQLTTKGYPALWTWLNNQIADQTES